MYRDDVDHLNATNSAPVLKSKPSSIYSDSQPYFLNTNSTNGDLVYAERSIAIPIRNVQRDEDELNDYGQYRYELSRKQLKASSNISALLAGFAMVCAFYVVALVELHYPPDTPHWLLIVLAITTTLLVSVHLLALMMSTCILPYIEATGCTKDSPHTKLRFYIEISWFFSTCLGLVLFLLEIVLIFYMKFLDIGFEVGGYITTIMLIPVFIMFGVISYLIHKSIVNYSVGRGAEKIDTLAQLLSEEQEPLHKPSRVQLTHERVQFGLYEASNIKNV